jgi:hypothetical protein
LPVKDEVNSRRTASNVHFGSKADIAVRRELEANSKPREISVTLNINGEQRTLAAVRPIKARTIFSIACFDGMTIL